MIFVPGHGFQPLIPGIMSTHVSIVRATGTKHNHATLSEIIVPVTLQGLVLAKGVILVCSMGLVLLPPRIDGGKWALQFPRLGRRHL